MFISTLQTPNAISSGDIRRQLITARRSIKLKYNLTKLGVSNTVLVLNDTFCLLSLYTLIWLKSKNLFENTP